MRVDYRAFGDQAVVDAGSDIGLQQLLDFFTITDSNQALADFQRLMKLKAGNRRQVIQFRGFPLHPVCAHHRRQMPARLNDKRRRMRTGPDLSTSSR